MYVHSCTCGTCVLVSHLFCTLEMYRVRKYMYHVRMYVHVLCTYAHVSHMYVHVSCIVSPINHRQRRQVLHVYSMSTRTRMCVCVCVCLYRRTDVL